MSVADARPQQNGVDLSSCDREPIHIPGSIQPHGVLFALAEGTLDVTQVSDNVEQFLGRSADAVINRPMGDVLGENVAQQLRAMLASPSLDRSPVYLGTLSLASADAPV